MMTVDAQAVALTFLSQILLGRFGEALRARLRRRSAPSRNASGGSCTTVLRAW